MDADTRTAWLEARRRSLGGSDAAAVLGISPWQTPLQLYQDKRGLTPPDAETTRLWLGRNAEYLCALAYRRETGRHAITDPGDMQAFLERRRKPLTYERYGEVLLCRSTKYPALHACPDALAFDADGRLLVVDFKTQEVWRKDEWAEGLPDFYAAQLRHNSIVLETDGASCLALIGWSEVRWADQERSELLESAYLVAALAFQQMILTGTPPPPTTADDAQVSFPDSNGESKALAADLLGMDEEYVALENEIAGRQERREEIRQAMRFAIGDAEFGVLPDGCAWRYSKPNARGVRVLTRIGRKE